MRKEKKEYTAIAIGFFLIIFVIALTLFRNNPFSNDDQNYQKTISAKDLQKKLVIEGAKANISLLDIRSFEDYSKEHIADAVNVPLDEFPAASKIDSHNLVIVIGSNGNDENIGKALKKLAEEGFKNISVLAGGMESWTSFAGTTVTYGNPSSFVDQSKVFYADPDKVKEALDQNVPMFIVDVRSSDEYSEGHIPGAKNIPSEEIEKRRSEISENKVVVVGINELQEFQSSVQMYDMLLVSPYVLKGGMPKWVEKGFPIEK